MTEWRLMGVEHPRTGEVHHWIQRDRESVDIEDVIDALNEQQQENKIILQAAGLPPTHVLKPTGYSQSFPSNWKDTARFFRVLEWTEISSFDGFVSALFDGFPVFYGRTGHAICGVRVVRATWPQHRLDRCELRRDVEVERVRRTDDGLVRRKSRRVI